MPSASGLNSRPHWGETPRAKGDGLRANRFDQVRLHLERGGREAGLQLRVLALLLALLIAGLAPATAIAQDTAADASADEAGAFDELDPFDDLDAAENEADDDLFGDEPLDEDELESLANDPAIEELVVTATKRKQSVQDVPVSVTALDGGFLEETGSSNFADLQKFVPNLQILPVTDTRSTSIRIRGIGSVGSNAGIDPSVGVFIDGVYQGRAGMSVQDLLDIERVEVLRGPQGTLYGKNTAAGAINIITKSPTDEFEAFAETVLGNYSLMEFRGSVNGPIVPDALYARIAGYKVLRDGYDTNRYDGQRVNDADKWGIRTKVLWEATDSLDIQLVGDYAVDASKCCVADIVTYDGPGTLGVTFEDFAEYTGIPLDEEDPFDRVVGANTDPRNRVTVGGIALDLNTDFGEHTLRWLTSWRSYTSDSQFDGDFSIYNAVISSTDVDFDQVSSELLIVSPGGETIEYQGGLFFFFSNNDTVDVLTQTEDFAAVARDNGVPVIAASNTNTNEHRTYNLAGFGQATWNIGPEWSLTGGFRLDWERKTRVGLSVSDCVLLAPPICGPPDARDEQRDVVNPQGTLIARYRPTDDAMIYASFATGFKSGGFNQLRTSESFVGPLNSEFDDEISLNYELGTKTNWFDQTVLANLTAYFTDYRDFQAQLFNGSSIVVDNAGQLYSWGIEAETRWVPDFFFDRNLVLGGSFGLNFTKYQDFEGAPMTVPQQDEFVYSNPPSNFLGGDFPDDASGLACALEFNSPPNPVESYNCSQDLTGQRLDNAPRITLTLFASYEHEIPNTQFLWFANTNYLLETFKYLATDLDRNTIQDPINLLGFRTGFRTDDDRLELTFWLENATNEGWLVASSDVPILSGYFGVNAPPRTYGGTIRVRF